MPGEPLASASPTNAKRPGRYFLPLWASSLGIDQRRMTPSMSPAASSLPPGENAEALPGEGVAKGEGSLDEELADVGEAGPGPEPEGDVDEELGEVGKRRNAVKAVSPAVLKEWNSLQAMLKARKN